MQLDYKELPKVESPWSGNRFFWRVSEARNEVALVEESTGLWVLRWDYAEGKIYAYDHDRRNEELIEVTPKLDAVPLLPSFVHYLSSLPWLDHMEHFLYKKTGQVPVNELIMTTSKTSNEQYVPYSGETPPPGENVQVKFLVRDKPSTKKNSSSTKENTMAHDEQQGLVDRLLSHPTAKLGKETTLETMELVGVAQAQVLIRDLAMGLLREVVPEEHHSLLENDVVLDIIDVLAPYVLHALCEADLLPYSDRLGTLSGKAFKAQMLRTGFKRSDQLREVIKKHLPQLKELVKLATNLKKQHTSSSIKNLLEHQLDLEEDLGLEEVSELPESALEVVTPVEEHLLQKS